MAREERISSRACIRHGKEVSNHERGNTVRKDSRVAVTKMGNGRAGIGDFRPPKSQLSTPESPQILGDLKSDIDDLEDALGVLFRKMKPVLMPPSCAQLGTDAEIDPDAHSPISMALIEARNKIQSLSAAITDATVRTRLE